MLNLAEELLLLSLNDAKGKVRGSVSSYIQYGLAGALLADLALRGKLVVGEKKRLSLAEGPLTGDPLLDATAEQLHDSSRDRKATAWVQRLGRGKLIKGVAERLVEQNVLRAEEKLALGLFPYTVYPLIGAEYGIAMTKAQILTRLRSAASSVVPPEPRTMALLSLANATRVLPLVLDRTERKAAARKIKEWAKGDVYGEAVAQVLAGIDAAIIAVVASSSSAG